MRIAAAVAIAVCLPAAVAAQPKYIEGLFVADPVGPVELIAYAEMRTNGELVMVSGSLEDAPEMSEVTRVLVNFPLWRPAGMFVASGKLFSDDRAERRTVTYGVRKINVYATELFPADTSPPGKLAELARKVGATEEHPAYLFIALTNGAVVRHYPVRIGVH